jgi:hypothetical protein
VRRACISHHYIGIREMTTPHQGRMGSIMYVGRVEAPGSSPICLSGKIPQIGPQIPYNLRLKSPIPDKAAMHVICHICDPTKKKVTRIIKIFSSAVRVQESAWGWIADSTVYAYKLLNCPRTMTEHIKRVIRHYLDIFPPGILILDNFANVFCAAGFVSEFQCFAASPVRCKL